MTMFRRLATLCTRHPQRGATAVEYALMVMLIALVIIAGVTVVGTSVSTIFANAASGI